MAPPGPAEEPTAVIRMAGPPPNRLAPPNPPTPPSPAQPTRRYEQALPPPAPAADRFEPEPAYEPAYEPDVESDRYDREPADHPPYEQEYEPRPRRRERPGRGYEPAEESPMDYQRARDRRADRTVFIANFIHATTALIALDFVLHIVFTLFNANQNSGFVAFVYAVAKVFVFGFGDVFTPGDAKIGLVLNYGLAAIVYLVVGRIIYRTLRR
jgi:hypothetical protein